MTLIIVESPTKARTFNRILQGKDYFVFATQGHTRDLPHNKLSIDYEKQFQPTYKIVPSKKKIIKELKNLAKKDKEIIFATDPDREGESIAYHIAYILEMIDEQWPEIKIKDKINIKRIIFHEITQEALAEALKKPVSIRLDLVKAQMARRILDRIVGYELSPLLWKKIGKNWLSAGRVQSIALRLIVEREKEIEKFKSEPYFQIYGLFKNEVELKAKLIEKDGSRFEITSKINCFDGKYEFTKTTISEQNINQHLNDIKADAFVISEIRESVSSRTPPSPFSTSLLQQEGFQRFGYSSKMTMKLAQDLYERGLITYHRTDSFQLSQQFLSEAKKYIQSSYGNQYILEKPRLYKTKSKMAQEAHEAIRPTRLERSIPEDEQNNKLTLSHRRLYELIFDRAVATQMKEAQIKQIKVLITSTKAYVFSTDYHTVIFDGFLRVLNPKFVEENKASVELKQGSALKLLQLEPQNLMTKPPPRYNEASLIKSLEERGIGRPSTYAPIISLIQDKFYVEKINRSFAPTMLGTVISDYLSSSFSQIFDPNFTATMEDGLDSVANNEKAMTELLRTFYVPFKSDLETRKEDKTVINIEKEVDELCPKCASKLMIRFSRFGKFLACSRFPNCKFTKPFTESIPDKKCPECGGMIVVRYTKRRKKFYGCSNYPTCNYATWRL